MSSEPKPDAPMASDDELDAYLRGEHALTRRYRDGGGEQPPPDLDDAVLRMAEQAVRRPPRRRRWPAPLALAAVLVLGLGVVIELWREPQVRSPQPEAAVVAPDADPMAMAAAMAPPPPAAMPEAPSAPLPEPAPRPPVVARSQKKAAPVAEDAGAQAAMPPPPAPMAAPPAFAAALSVQQEQQAMQQRRESAEAQAALSRERREASKAMVREALPEAWREPLFNGLMVGRVSRAAVYAMYGAPEREEPAGSGSATPYWQGLAFDVYRFNGSPTPNTIEFYYDSEQTLVGIHRVWDPPREIHDLVVTNNHWQMSEARAQATPPCGATPAAQLEPEMDLQYWVFASRGAYVVVQGDTAGREVFYIANCPE